MEVAGVLPLNMSPRNTIYELISFPNLGLVLELSCYLSYNKFRSLLHIFIYLLQDSTGGFH